MSKIRKWLYPNEAELLGLKIRVSSHKYRKNALYTIDQEQWKFVQ